MVLRGTPTQENKGQKFSILVEVKNKNGLSYFEDLSIGIENYEGNLDPLGVLEISLIDH